MKIRFWWMWLVLVAVLFGVACSQGDDDDDNGQGNPADDDAEDDDAVDDDTADDDTADDDTADDDLAPPCEHLFPFTLVPGSRNVPFPNDLFTYIDPTSPTYRRVYMTSGNVATFYDPVIAKWPTLAESMDQLNGFVCFGSLLIPASTAPMMSVSKRPARSVSSSRSTVASWETLTTQSRGTPPSPAVSRTFPGASASRRVEVIDAVVSAPRRK